MAKSQYIKIANSLNAIFLTALSVNLQLNAASAMRSLITNLTKKQNSVAIFMNRIAQMGVRWGAG